LRRSTERVHAGLLAINCCPDIRLSEAVERFAPDTVTLRGVVSVH
jgi:hypothetical protein